METQQETNSNAGKALGIAGLVLGILAAVISFIPCLGMYALFPGILGLIFSAVSLSQATKRNASKGLAIAGLICALVGMSIASWQYYVLNKAADELKKGADTFKKEMEKIDSINKKDNVN